MFPLIRDSHCRWNFTRHAEMVHGPLPWALWSPVFWEPYLPLTGLCFLLLLENLKCFISWRVLVWKGFLVFFLCWFCFVLLFQWITKRLFTWPKHLCGSKGYEVLWCMGREPCNGGNSQCSICAMSPLPSCLKTTASEGLTSTVAGRRLRSKKETEHYMGFRVLPTALSRCHVLYQHPLCSPSEPTPSLHGEALLWISKPTRKNQEHWQQAQGLSQGDSPLFSITGHGGFDLSCSQKSLTTLVAAHPVCPVLLPWHPPVLHLSMHLRKVLHPKGLFRLPGKFEPLINLLGQGDDGVELCFSLSVWAIVLKAQQRAVIWHAAP